MKGSSPSLVHVRQARAAGGVHAISKGCISVAFPPGGCPRCKFSVCFQRCFFRASLQHHLAEHSLVQFCCAGPKKGTRCTLLSADELICAPFFLAACQPLPRGGALVYVLLSDLSTTQRSSLGPRGSRMSGTRGQKIVRENVARIKKMRAKMATLMRLSGRMTPRLTPPLPALHFSIG